MIFGPPAIEFTPGLSSDMCVVSAATTYGVPADLMLAVRSVERGMPHQSVGNKDGSSDFNEPGLNSRTLDELVERWGWDGYRLRVDGCYAMYAATFWMQSKMKSGKQQVTLLSRAARYNSGTPTHNEDYQARLAPFIGQWACYLFVHWKSNPQELFVVQSGLLKSYDLDNQCIRK